MVDLLMTNAELAEAISFALEKNRPEFQMDDYGRTTRDGDKASTMMREHLSRLLEIQATRAQMGGGNG